jgi:DnaJ-class molecular chaperone
MESTSDCDYYETLQISANAEPDTIHRVYRLLAPRFHPDNLETGDESRFRAITEAYHILIDPEKRAQYDIVPASLASTSSSRSGICCRRSGSSAMTA